ncbi:hypothetical protein KCV00_g202, partial [Aureobasidium melanogenum]
MLVCLAPLSTLCLLRAAFSLSSASRVSASSSLLIRRRLRRYEVKLLRFGAGEVDILEDGSDGLVSQVADVEMEYGVRNVASLWYNGSP